VSFSGTPIILRCLDGVLVLAQQFGCAFEIECLLVAHLSVMQ
jgi:hypothetical protein